MADSPSPSPAGRLWERYRVFARPLGGRFKLSVAFAIVLVSILAAGMAWRASVWSERSANTDEITRQDIVQREQILAGQAETINQDIRAFNSFEEATLLAQELERDARKLSGRERLELELEAGSQRAEAKSLRRFFAASAPVVDPESGRVSYDPAFTRRLLLAYSPDLEVLRPEELREEARLANIKSVRLTGLAALFVAALLFLTLAEVTRRSISGWFAGAGGATATAALVLYLFVV